MSIGSSPGGTSPQSRHSDAAQECEDTCNSNKPIENALTVSNVGMATPEATLPDISGAFEDCPHVGGSDVDHLRLIISCLWRNISLNYSQLSEHSSGVEGVSTTTIEPLMSEFFVCNVCGNRKLKDLDACLECVFVGCSFGNHCSDHHNDFEHSHFVNLKSGKPKCLKCLNSITEDVATSKDVGFVEGKAPEYTGFMDELLSVVKNDYFKSSQMLNFSQPPIGIINIGNSCFMNCILQVLFLTPLLKSYFLSGKHRCCGETSNQQYSKCITCELAILFQYAYISPRDCKLNAENLILSLHGGNERVTFITQQDAHEYLRIVLEKLHNEATRFKEFNTLEDSYGSVNSSPSQIKDLPSTSECFCFLDKIFQGSFVCKIQCVSCGTVSKNSEPFVDISLGVPQFNTESGGQLESQSCGASGKRIKSVSLEHCLQRFMGEEHLDENAASFCGSCNSTQLKMTKSTIKRLPPIICLHLKKFMITSTIEKLDMNVEFPLRLDMDPHISSKTEHFTNDEDDEKNISDIHKSGGTVYALYGVVVHKGSYESGHYFSYVKNNNQWYMCDDEEIKVATEDEVTKSECYILFYMKENALKEFIN